MKSGIPWNVAGIGPEARANARQAARRSGLSLGEWLNSVILEQTTESDFYRSEREFENVAGELSEMRQRLNELNRRIADVGRSSHGRPGPAPRKQNHDDGGEVTDLIERLERRLESFVAVAHSMPRYETQHRTPEFVPSVTPTKSAQATSGENLSGLEGQLRRITDQIETLRRSGVEDAIGALRSELVEIGRALNEALPRRALDTIEKQIQELGHRITEGQNAGAHNAALAAIEHNLAEVRDALRGLTPAESLVGFTDAVDTLARKIDRIVSERDPATLSQLEQAIGALREMVTHVASNKAVDGLAAQVRALGDKIEQMRQAADTVAVNQIEDRIVTLTQRLDASDLRLRHLENIESGLAEVLDHIRESKAVHAAQIEEATGIGALKCDIARNQTAIETVNGTLARVADRLATIEKDIRSESRQQTETVLALASDDEPLDLGNLDADLDDGALPNAGRNEQLSVSPSSSIDTDLHRDQPLEPGSGPPRVRAGARIAASEVVLGDLPPTPQTASRSDFIAAARRAAQAAVRETSASTATAETRIHADESADGFSPTRFLMRRGKPLLVAACIVAIVIGSIQVAGHVLINGSARQPPHNTKVSDSDAPTADTLKAESDAAALDADVSLSPAALTAQKPIQETAPAFPPPSSNVLNAPAPPNANEPLQGAPSVFDPPAVQPGPSSKNDATGSIFSAPAMNYAANPAAPISIGGERLPVAIGGKRLRDAAINGDPAAAYTVALRYAEGHGVPANIEEAARWFKRATDKGFTPAQFRYASMLEKGQGVKKDLGQARELYLAAAAKGHAKSMHNLAVLYAEGIDGKPDYAAAAVWFRKAANHGIADSQYNLGILAERGLGTEKSLTESYKWFALAAAQGDKESMRKRDDIASELDPEQLAFAQREIETFLVMPQRQEAILVPVPPGGWDGPAAIAPVSRGKPQRNAPMQLSAFKIGTR